jgi:ketosteroid isomerase-like protein
MVDGARTPEELERLFEDAFVTCDRGELCALFHEGAVLASAAGGPEARGEVAIGRSVTELWDGGGIYVAGASRVLQARDLALVVGQAGIHVVRRSADGSWRAAITLLDLDGSTKREAA